MVITIKKIDNIIKGEEPISDIQRYGAICHSLTWLHVCFLIIFIAMNCVPLIIYNLLIIPFFLFLINQEKNSKNRVIGFSLIYLEVFFHDMLACILIGWTFGFSLYNLGLIPVSFYIAYLTQGFKHRIRTASILTLFNVIITLVIRMYVYMMGPIYVYDKTVALGLSVFNCTISFLMVGAFSILYILEIRNAEVILKKKNDELFYLANYDSLTHLYNRRCMEHFLHDSMRDAMKEDTTFCVILGDIDDFKLINDTFGHMVGDMVLVKLAKIMQGVIKDGNVICRWGGEEILLIIKEDLKKSVMIVEEIRKQTANMDCFCENDKIGVTLTYGIEEYEKGKTIEKMIHHADIKLYEGKQKGKDCIII